MADVFIGSEFAAPSAIIQLYCGVCPITFTVRVQSNFAETCLIAGVLAQFVTQAGKDLNEALY